MTETQILNPTNPPTTPLRSSWFFPLSIISTVFNISLSILQYLSLLRPPPMMQMLKDYDHLAELRVMKSHHNVCCLVAQILPLTHNSTLPHCTFNSLFTIFVSLSHHY